MNGGGRSAAASRHLSPAAGITPRLAEILALMLEAALEAEDAAPAHRGKVTATTQAGAPSGPIPIEDRRRETREESR